jgi:transaldolase
MDGGDGCTESAQFATAGIDVRTWSAKLQDEGAKSFVNSWNDLMSMIKSKSAMLERTTWCREFQVVVRR